MPLLKAFYFTGDYNSAKSRIMLGIGIIGACVILLGLINNSDELLYVIGALLLLLTAIYFQLVYFIALELILLAGHGALLLNLGLSIQIALPIFLSIQLFVYYLLTGQSLQNIFRLIGICGVAILSIGFAYTNEWLYFFGALGVTIYAYYKFYIGVPVALLWAILNLIFAIFSFIIIIFNN